MKTNNIFKVVICSFLGLAAASCAEKMEYTPAPLEDATKTYVRADETAPRNLDIDGTDILVPFVRNTKTGALDVNVALSDTSGIFTLKTPTITFAEGDSTAFAAVSYSYDALVPDIVYSLSVAITSEGVTSEYAAAAFPLACKKAWQDLGMAQWYDAWWIGGPFEKRLLKSPTGIELYRLVNPWDQQSVVAAELEFVEEMPYLEFFITDKGEIIYAPVFKADGTVAPTTVLDLGFKMSGMTLHMLHPLGQGDTASAAQNAMVMDKVAQFCWYPILNFTGSSFSWWGKTSYAYISFPGGPDLAELLEL